MTAEEYVKHYVSGQGGFESVSVDVALRAIEYAKQEAKQQLMKDATDVQYTLMLAATHIFRRLNSMTMTKMFLLQKRVISTK